MVRFALLTGTLHIAVGAERGCPARGGGLVAPRPAVLHRCVCRAAGPAPSLPSSSRAHAKRSTVRSGLREWIATPARAGSQWRSGATDPRRTRQNQPKGALFKACFQCCEWNAFTV